MTPDELKTKAQGYARPVSRAPWAQVAAGFFYPLRGASLVLRDRKLLALSAVPILVTAIIYGTGLYFVVSNFDALINWVWAEPALEAWYDYLLLGLWYLLWPIVALTVGAVIYFTLVVACTIVAIPFLDAISEKVEGFARGRNVSIPFTLKGLAGDIGRGASHSLIRLAVMLALLAVVVAVGFVFPPVSAIGVPIIVMFFSAIEYLDVPMARNRKPFDTKKSMVLSNKLMCMGFGAFVFLVLAVPLLVIFCLPAFAAGATLMYVGLEPDA